MNILYIHQYFSSREGKTGTRSYEFAKRWVNRGNDVRIVTTTAMLSSAELCKITGRFVKRFSIDSVEVIAADVFYDQELGYARRMISFVMFLCFASLVVVFGKKPDVVYSSSTPISVGVPAILGRILRRVPYVFEVRDQWPKIPVELGILKNRMFVILAFWLEKTIYRLSEGIVTLSPGQKKGVELVTQGKKAIKVIPNCCDVDLFRFGRRDDVRLKHGWKDRLVLLHAGAMGKVNSLEFLVDAARRMRSFPRIRFVLIGEGSQKANLLSCIRSYGLSNLDVLPAVQKRRLPDYFAACDVGIVVIGDYPILEDNSANKFFDTLSAGKPVLLNYSGWQRELIEKHNCGFGCRLYDVDQFVAKVLWFYKNEVNLEEMGRNAHELAVGKFNRDSLAHQCLEYVLSLVNMDR